MKLSIKILDIFFRHIISEQVLSGILGVYQLDGDANYRKHFMEQAEATLGGYSVNEQQNIYDYTHQVYEKYTFKKNLPPFYLLVDFANKVFEAGERSPVCRYQEVLNWRDAYLILGQDIFTTAWLACHSQTHRRPLYFSWPPTLPVNDPILRQITVDLAENHMHLYAGASTFSLTWSCAMNHPRTVLDNEAMLETLLQVHNSRGSKSNVWSIKRRMLYAAFIRMFLFARLHGSEDDAMSSLRVFNDGYCTDELELAKLEKSLAHLRFLYGLPFAQPGGQRSVCLDYAFSSELTNEISEHSRLLAAERFFLYSCFQKCFSEEFSEDEQWIFYIYLLLKSNFRSEFIQVNQQKGFHNFSSYDKRKYSLWRDRPEYWNEDYRQALNAALEEQSITALEGRTSPMDSAFKNLTAIHSIDRAKLFHDAQSFDKRWELNFWKADYNTENKAADEAFFYVLHFPKRTEHLTASYSSQLICRHGKYRKDVRNKAIELAKALSNSSYLCQRIRGIDACSHEIGCRPEVFATAFRFLREFPVRYYRSQYSSEMPRLAVTYHVGEDFLDIADGLRAMDEAIRFLDLRRGDRFGHALALGIDPHLHYETKHHQIVLPKQDLLDNLVWICQRSIELNVEIPANLRGQLLSRANLLFDEIYDVNNEEYSLEEYYQSMLLRGDSPGCFRTGRFVEPFTSNPYDTFGKNDREEIADELTHFRNRSKITNLCFFYHYCYKAKSKGEEFTTMMITPEYVSLMAAMQEAMQRVVNDCGINIECNPSSNVLIGTFGSYKNHPILRFNNEGLNFPRKSVQMHVSINSDDPGVFDTTLTFEYALLSQSLHEMTDENGERLHSDREIENYLRNVVRMGREQSFFT